MARRIRSFIAAASAALLTATTGVVAFPTTHHSAAPRAQQHAATLARRADCPESLGTALQAANFSSQDILHLPSDADFGTSYSRYNLHVASTPCAVVKVANVNDVAETVKAVVASQSGVHIQAKSGGHSYANYGLGGADGQVAIMLDALTDYSYDASTELATIGSGFTLGPLSDKMEADGRFTAHGNCPQVGVGGHATIGGLGYMSRMVGPLLDQVVSAQVVTANGTIVTASADENPDLLFALKGAGASFGIATQFTIKTYPFWDTIQYSYNFKLSKHVDMVDTFAGWQNFMNSDPDHRFSSLVLMSIDSMIITGAFTNGTQEEFDALGFQQALGEKQPDSSTVDLRSGWNAILHDFENVGLQIGGGIPAEFYSKSLVIPTSKPFSNQTIQDWMQYLDDTDPGTEAWFVIADGQGGQPNTVPVDATAYPHRDTLFMIQAYSLSPLVWTGYNDQMTKFLDGEIELLQQATSDTPLLAYAGYVDPEINKEQYWGSNYPRLVEIKAAWDPENIFANPQSVGDGLGA